MNDLTNGTKMTTHTWVANCAWCNSEIWKHKVLFGESELTPPYHEYDGQHYICNPEGHPGELLATDW